MVSMARAFARVLHMLSGKRTSLHISRCHHSVLSVVPAARASLWQNIQARYISTASRQHLVLMLSPAPLYAATASPRYSDRY